MVGIEIEGGRYQKFTVQGKMPDAVVEQWQTIWSRDKELNRRYTADFEVYGAKAQDPGQAAVDIFIAVE